MTYYKITVTLETEADSEAEAIAIFSEDVSTDGKEIFAETATLTVVNEKWKDDSVQFPRLIAEINANVNITGDDWDDLCDSMDLPSFAVHELFERADAAWEKAKDNA